MKLTEIKINPNNPRQIKDDKFKKLCNSIKEFPKMMGLRPIVVDKDMMILGGNMRFKVLQELGYKELPDKWIKIASELTDDEKKRFIVEDNLPFGEWNFDELANQYEIDDLLEWGFDEKDLQIGIDEKDNEIPETPTETDIKIGDKFKLGEHILVCGDSQEYSTYYSLMDKEKAKLVFTSPPYNIGGGMYKGYKDNLASQEYIDFNLRVIKNCKLFLSGFVFWNLSYNKKSRWEFIEIFYKMVKEIGLKFLELIVWDKGHGMPITSKEMITRQYEDIFLVGDEENIKQDLDYYFCGQNKTAYFNRKTGKGLTNYWKIGTNRTQIDDNKACFPIELPLKAIEMMTDRGDIVLEPFAGSGSTMIACEKSDRKCRMIEIDPILCQLIVNRYKNFTGEKATKL